MMRAKRWITMATIAVIGLFVFQPLWGGPTPPPPPPPLEEHPWNEYFGGGCKGNMTAPSIQPGGSFYILQPGPMGWFYLLKVPAYETALPKGNGSMKKAGIKGKAVQ